MHAGSANRLSTTDPLTSSECAAKSLFHQVLALSPYGSRFCPAPAPSPSCKCLRMNILAIRSKKYCGESEANSLSQNMLAVSPCGSIFCADTSLSKPRKYLRMNILRIMKKKISKRPYFGEIGILESKSRFLHSAVAFAPAPVGMTMDFYFAGISTSNMAPGRAAINVKRQRAGAPAPHEQPLLPSRIGRVAAQELGAEFGPQKIPTLTSQTARR